MAKMKAGAGSIILRFLIQVLPGITHFFVRYIAKDLPAPKEVVPVAAVNKGKTNVKSYTAATSEVPIKGAEIGQEYVRLGEPRSTGEFLLYVDRVADKLAEVEKLNGLLDKISRFLAKSEFQDVLENYTNKKRMLWSNFLAGLARGLGLTVGTAIVLAIVGWVLAMFIDLPLIGKFIANIQQHIDAAKH